MERKCDNCLHRTKSVYFEPCYSCFGSEEHPNFEPNVKPNGDLEKLMKNTGESEESILLLLGIGALRAEEFAVMNGDLIEEFRARRIYNEVSILLRKKGCKI